MTVFNWEDIDHSLVSLKLTDLAEEMHRQIRADERRIHFENRHNLNTSAVPSLVLQMEEQRADEWARRAYDIYCEVWQIQGRTKSASFIRAVFARSIAPMLNARASAIAHEFELFPRRTGFPAQLANANLTGVRLRMTRLQEQWRRRLEVEAKECEHAERTKSTSTFAPNDSSQSTQPQPQSDSSQPSEIERSKGNAGALSEPGEKSAQPSAPVQPFSPLSTSEQSTDRKPSNSALPQDPRREAVIKKVRNPQANTILTIPEAACYFEITAHTIYVWVSEGKLKRGPKRGSITIESIQRWQKKRSRKRRAL